MMIDESVVCMIELGFDFGAFELVDREFRVVRTGSGFRAWLRSTGEEFARVWVKVRDGDGYRTIHRPTG